MQGLWTSGDSGSLQSLAIVSKLKLEESPVRLEISRIDSLSRACHRRITLNKSTSITPYVLLLSLQQEHIGRDRRGFIECNTTMACTNKLR